MLTIDDNFFEDLKELAQKLNALRENMEKKKEHEEYVAAFNSWREISLIFENKVNLIRYGWEGKC